MKHTAILSIMVLTFATLCTAQVVPREKVLTGPPRNISSQPAPKNTCSALGLNFIIAIQGVIADPDTWTAETLLGEIRLIAGEVAPKGWALCHGQLMQIQYNTALFALFGNRFGGDGKNTFALPNLKDAAPVGAGEIWPSGKRAQIE